MAKTFANLKADLAAYANRSDLTAQIPLFVLLSEEEIFKTNAKPLRVREMETTATVTITGNSGALPSDYLEAKYLRIGTSKLFYKPSEDWDANGSAGFFTVIGTTLWVPNGTSGNATLVYYAKPAALSADGDTNAVLDGYYSIFLFAGLMNVADYVKKAADVDKYATLLATRLANANANNKTQAGPLVVRPS